MDITEFYGKIEDPNGLPEDVKEIRTSELTSGKTITHPAWLSGGGQIHKKYFLEALGNKKYKNAYEWCAGHGEIGFEIITNGICETLAFSDMHPASAEWCLQNAKELGLQNNVFAYTSLTIAGLPQDRLWDLVVGNPPNAQNPDLTQLNWMRSNYLSPDHIQLFARTTWDCEFRSHAEFFENIGNYTTPDVDIFLSINETSLDYIKNNFLVPSNLEVIKIVDMFPDDPGLKVVHIKKEKLTTYSKYTKL